nr:N-glycosylase/DNA lyase [Candidatus Njordarchaeum guaymaensis]
MEELLRAVENLKKTEVKKSVDARMREFKDNCRKTSEKIFEELCFCILAANFNAERTMKIQEKIGHGFLTLPESKLVTKLRQLGYRFPTTRAKYILKAREHKDSLKEIIESSDSCNELREWLVENIYGIGCKEASHFLRNIGFTDFAILDFHIINLLERCGSVERPKTLTKRKYLEIEEQLREIAAELELSLAELDLYLWYMETGKILK